MQKNYLYADETQIIIGVLFDVYNELGWGFKEKRYEQAIIFDLSEKGFNCNSQKYCPIYYKNKRIGFNKCDILVDNKILIELKVGEKLFKKDFDQVNEYLKNFNIKIAILALYSPNGVTPRRLINNPT